MKARVSAANLVREWAPDGFAGGARDGDVPR
jgi:hypothetical protein